MMTRLLFVFFAMFLAFAEAASYQLVRSEVPDVQREFRGAWVAVVYNIDWPSRPGLSAAAQRAELRAIMDRAAGAGLNAIMFQIRPAGDAIYRSKHEPWAHWLTGKGGGDPGYDPLEEAIRLAHARGIELHAWFNPFRAQASLKHPLSRRHLASSGNSWVKTFGDHRWFDPSSRESHTQALKVILDVTRRYDIDGVHLDDYFYPYPKVVDGRSVQDFPDSKEYERYRRGGGTLGKHDWRRDNVNRFVRSLYVEVKKAKPWVRVGISPFGIWRPGVPRGTEAGLDSYDHLFADSRLWLAKGWCDYLAPQLYWRDAGPQSFSKLITWWRSQSQIRPVWPGIATSRIDSKEDPGRPASEIIKQINLSRRIGNSSAGHLHWSMKSLMQNRGGILKQLGPAYQGPALPPAMPWLGRTAPAAPNLRAEIVNGETILHFSPNKAGAGVRKWVVQIRQDGKWRTYQVVQGPYQQLRLPMRPELIALRGVSGYGNLGPASVLQIR